MSLKFLGKAAFLYAVGNVCLRASSFLLLPIYTHYLSIEDFGLLMTALLTSQFMMVGMNLGMEHCLVRFAKECEKNNLLNLLLGTSCFISLVSAALVSCMSLTLLIPFFQSVLHTNQVYMLAGLICVVSFLQSFCDHLVSYYRAQNRPLMYTIIGIFTAIILIITSFIILNTMKMGVEGALVAKTITYSVVLMVLGWNIFSKTGFSVSTKLIIKLLHFGAPLALSSVSQYAISGVSIYFLSILAGLEAVAIFSLGYKLATVLLMILVLPFQLSFQPFVFSKLDSPDIKKQMGRLLTYFVLAVSMGAFCVLFGSRLLMPLIATTDFTKAYTVTVLMMPAMAFMGMFQYAETQLKAAQKSYIIGLIVAICALFALMANYVLVRFFSWYGAIIASNTTFLLLGGTLFVIGMKEFPVPIERRRILTGIILFIAVMLLNLLLLKVNDYMYYAICLIAAGLTIWVLLAGRFCDASEKQLLFNIYYKLKSIVIGNFQKCTKSIQ